MSGGHFDYKEHHIQDIISSIEVLIQNNKMPDEFGWNYSEQTILKFKEAVKLLKKAYDLVHRIDYLVSGDDGEDTFWEQVK